MSEKANWLTACTGSLRWPFGVEALLAIDPGNIESGYAILADDYTPIMFGKVANEDFVKQIISECTNRNIGIRKVVIERIKSYGMAVGQSVFDTCVVVGRFSAIFEIMLEGKPTEYVGRKEYIVDLIGTPKAKDANVIQYLIDRFAPNTPNRGKGTKKDPGFFYGFRADVWQAYAIGVWALDKEKGKV